jgi:hypothetical protein
MNKQRLITLIFILTILASAAVTLDSGNSAYAQSIYQLSMPQEYLNYTITVQNGALWAIIDGEYPMHYSSFSGEMQLPMIYPTPPNTTNVHVYLDGSELVWSNYTEIYPTARHYTDIGNWQMISTVITPAAQDFMLAIHYEHPVEKVNGTYMFLYDLNIIHYLSEETPNSTAHFTVRIEPHTSAINVYTTGLNGIWSTQAFKSAQEGNTQIMEFSITSEYSKPLWGDIAVTLTDPQIPELQPRTILTIAALSTALSVTILYNKRRQKRLKISAYGK